MSGFLSKRSMIIIITIISIAVLMIFILPVSVPIILALITALFLNPLVNLLQEKAKMKRHLSVLIVFLIFSCFIGFSGFFVTTKVVAEVIKLVENSPHYFNDLMKAWLKFETNLSTALQDLPQDLVNEISKQVQDFLTKIKDELVAYVNIDNVKALLTNIPNYLVSFLVYLIALFLFLLDLPRLKEGIFNHLTDKTADKVHFMTSRLSYVIFGFCKAQLLVSIIIFIVSLIGLFLISPDIALIMSLIIWIIDVIPIIGSIVILGPWSLYHFFTGDIVLGTKLAILAAILLIIRRTVEPKVMGSQIGLSPLATLIAMYIGLKLFNIFGFFIGPLVLIIFNSAKEAGIIKFNFKI
ncbi:sporulation integral membrane protein YtvI [Bacillus aquiflavi]|uniref:Sporulation integral membrane protein YtvI n=1 Tax=Bacillus aquiflavi TaxID=2672567 RepID=A0A6B3VY19_9BACI|nr:sporulation integral membrane protein YtvI [Bacillus aquiflavi]MBA4537942.1 sporulation integral membrane protein YtvI [Bacillus aquiflavi]NEY82198.1 sporulation integral membrane protein YtvI [Bacillus aquiflavi]UAC49271.1 sporulation integral membrane protein YtvI [Bacillus aquiflavi]